MLENKKAVIFDLDGTLVDSMWMWGAIDVEYLKKHNHQLPNDLEHKIAGMSFTETSIYFKKRFKIADPLEKIQQEWIEMARYNYLNKAPLKPGAAHLLKYLQEHGIKMGIASSNSAELVHEVLNAHDISGYFSAVHTSCEVKSGKPSPDIYLLAAKQLGVRPDECLVFEDIPEGVMAGQRAGMTTCAIWDEFNNEQTAEIKGLADYYITSFDDIFDETYEVCKHE